jgi:hypothetical protein
VPDHASSVIADIDYDDDAREMRVVFRTGRIYIYLDVPVEAYDAFYEAVSWGQHFNAYIRDAYEHRVVR